MRQKLGEMLIEAGAIDQAQLRSALADQRRWGRPLGRTLVEMRLIHEDDLVRVLARQLGLQAVDLDRVAIPKTVIELIPAHLAKTHNVIAFDAKMKFIDLAMLDPTNLGVIDEIRIRTQLNPRPYLAGPQMIERALEKYYGASTALSTDYEIAFDAAEPKAAPAPDRGSIASEAREGLRPFQHRAATPAPAPARDREIDALQDRLSLLEAKVERDETVLRKLLSLLIDKGIATRDEIVERLG